MRRIIVVLTVAAVMVTMMGTFGTSASAEQTLCPPTGPSGGPATLVNSDEPHGVGFVCLDEQAQEFFCPPEYKLQLFRSRGSDPGVLAECVERWSSSNGGEGGAELTQSGDQQSKAGALNQQTNVS